MGTPVHYYRTYEILCSDDGYTIMKGDIEVLTVGIRDAHSGSDLEDCGQLGAMLVHAKKRIDTLLAS